MYALDSLGARTSPPMLFDDHQAPAAPAGPCQREYLNYEAVIPGRDAVSVTDPFDTVAIPMRAFRAGIVDTQKYVERPKE